MEIRRGRNSAVNVHRIVERWALERLASEITGAVRH
jgi:hypothetical protein